MNEIVKVFEDRPVRIVEENGNPLFVGRDVCKLLGYKNETDAMNRHCKGVVKRYPLSTDGGVQELRVISEPDVMRLICGSKLPAAVRFEKWVFEEVLPSIRKTGAYIAPNLGLEALGKLVLAIKKQYEFLVEENAMLRQKWEYAMQFLPKTGYGTKSKANGQRRTTIRRGANVAGNGRLIQFRDPDEVGYRSQMDLFGEYLPRMIFADAVNIINIHCPKLLEGSANV